MCAHGPHTHLLVDDVHPSQAVEAEAVQTLLAWLVNRVESGAGVLLLSAIKRAGLRGLSLRLWILWTDHGFKANLLLVGSKNRIVVWTLWKVIWAIVLQKRERFLALDLGEQQHLHADQ